jgi:hypothetical protein
MHYGDRLPIVSQEWRTISLSLSLSLYPSTTATVNSVLPVIFDVQTFKEDLVAVSLAEPSRNGPSDTKLGHEGTMAVDLQQVSRPIYNYI